jgi:hypothetical protein
MYFALKVINLALVKEDSIDQLQNEGTILVEYCIQVPSVGVPICVPSADWERPLHLHIRIEWPRFVNIRINLTSPFLVSLQSRY